MSISEEDLSDGIVIPGSDLLIRMHDLNIERFGGAKGIRSIDGLESAVGRAHSAIAYDESCDAIRAACLLADAIVRNHPFVDGNKRTGYAALEVSLSLNGLDFRPSEETADKIIALAAHDLPVSDFESWVRSQCVPDDTYRLLAESDMREDDPRPASQGPSF